MHLRRLPVSPLLSLAFLAVSAPPPVAAQDAPELVPAGSFDAEPFTRIRGLHVLPDGRFLVSDQVEEALYLVDPGSEMRTKIGGNGEGPGEYRQPISLYPFRADSALLLDLFNSRLAVLGPDGSIVRFEPMTRPGVSLPTGADRDGNLYWDDVSGVRIAKRDDPRVDTGHIFRFGIASGRIDTLASIRVPGPVNPGPLPEYDVWHVSPSGRLVIVRNQDTYRVDRVDADGVERRGPEIDVDRVTLSRSDRAALEERGMAGASMGAAGGRRPELPIPERFPYAAAVRALDDGRALVERLESPSETRLLLDVISADGRRIGSFRLPANRAVVTASGETLYAVRVDDLGFQWVEWYDIP